MLWHFIYQITKKILQPTNNVREENTLNIIFKIEFLSLTKSFNEQMHFIKP